MCGGRKRFKFTFLTALVTIFHYISQLTLPFTITVMSQPPEEDSQSICAVNSSISEERREMGSTEFAWTNQMYGNILGAYFIGYSVSTICSSLAVQKFGFYPLVKLLCFGSASATFLFPFVIKRSFYLGVILRICQGIFSGPYVPAFQGSWYWWGIPSEITTNIAIQTGGVTLGNILGSVGTGFIIRRLGWEYSFYFAGASQVLVGVLWVLLVDPKPETERCDYGFCSWKKLKIASAMTPDEKQLLKASRPPSKMTTKLSEIPLKAILTDPQVHLAVFGSFSVNLILLSCMTNTPTYLKRAFGLPIETITMCFGSIALGCLILNVLTAVFADKMRKKFTTTTVRKSLIAVYGMILIPSLACMRYFGCNYVAVISLLGVFTVFTSASAISGVVPIAAELSANYGSLVTGFVGSFGNFAGFASTKLMMFLLSDKNQGDPESWNIVFLLPVGLYTIFIVVFLTFGKIEVRPWARKNDEEYQSLPLK